MARTQSVGLSGLLSAPICMSYRKQQVSDVSRATSRHTAGNLWPPGPRLHMISFEAVVYVHCPCQIKCGVVAVFVASAR